VWWTWEVEDAFQRVKAGTKRAMKDLEAKLTAQLNKMVALVREPLQAQTRRKVLRNSIQQALVL
jgi:dynein heavy chain, axonemal